MIRSRAALAKAASAPSQTRSQITQALGLTMYIAALIGENCNLDQVAMEDEAVQAELDKFVKGVRDTVPASSTYSTCICHEGHS